MALSCPQVFSIFFLFSIPFPLTLSPSPLRYSNSEEFAADALLVFDNCQTFNEDDSEVGKAGHIMRRFFESRWEEFYQGKQANL